MESLLAGKEVMLDNLQCILQQIQLAESDAMVSGEGKGGSRERGVPITLIGTESIQKWN